MILLKTSSRRILRVSFLKNGKEDGDIVRSNGAKNVPSATGVLVLLLSTIHSLAVELKPHTYDFYFIY